MATLIPHSLTEEQKGMRLSSIAIYSPPARHHNSFMIIPSQPSRNTHVDCARRHGLAVPASALSVVETQIPRHRQLVSSASPQPGIS